MDPSVKPGSGVLKVPSVKKENTGFLEALEKEIPAFLYFIKQRSLFSTHQTRMWFTPKQIETPALFKLVQNNRNRVKNLASILLMIMEEHDLQEINLCPMDALNALSKTRLRTDLTQIRKILKQDWKLENISNSNRYEKFTLWKNGSSNLSTTKGRYFTINKTFILDHFEDQHSD